MSKPVLQQLEFTSRTAKRAQYEAFEFSIAPGGVVVQNGSYERPSEHEYLVFVEDGVPVACECPADENYSGACKHRVAVAIRKPVLTAATNQDVVADGGTVAGEPDKDEVDDCDCGELLGEFPCWECVRTGRRELPGVNSGEQAGE
ncbi:SWIM zinc finger family protein [Halobacteriaceae archaeon GCM10025711]